MIEEMAINYFKGLNKEEKSDLLDKVIKSFSKEEKKELLVHIFSSLNNSEKLEIAKLLVKKK